MRAPIALSKEIVVPNDPDKATITIRLLDDETLSQIEEKYMQYSLGENGNSIGVQPEGRASAVGRAAIKTWHNVYDANGKSMVCTPANINKIARSIVVKDDGTEMRFLKWVDEQHREYYDAVQKDREEARKN